jgi:serine/threonine-protein kinase
LALLNEQISGKYEILGALREGGMGSLYKVRHRLLDEIRVVKVIRSPADTGGEGADRFLREARAANRLRHPNVAVLHDFAIADDGQAFIVMEHIDGWNLLEVLSGYGPPPVSLTVEIARQSLKALGYLHRHKIVHRDVSPDNLMLSRDVDGHPLVKLIDLGIAKGLEGHGELTTTGVFLGKPRYGSPERFSGDEWDERSDLYSFGVVYELLTGRVPIAGSDPASLMAGHLFRPPLDFAETDPQGRVPPELRALVLQALAKKPQERIASAEAFVWELTLLQDRFPLTREDLDGVWNVLVPLGAGRAPVALRPGSTQDRLDAEFAMGRTPMAGTVTGEATLRTATAPAPHPPRPPEPAPNLAEILPFQAPGHISGHIADAGLPLASQATRRVTPIQDLDATWISRSPRLDTGPLRPAPIPGQDAAETPRKSRALWIAAAAGVAAALFAAGFLVSRHVDAPTAAVPASEAAAASTAPLPASSPAGPVQIRPEPSAQKSIIPSSRTSTGERRAAAKGPASAPVPLEPMKPGALILAGQPGAQPAEIKELPAYPYPAAAKGSGRKVSIHVAVLVDETGAVVESRIREGDTAGLGFNEAALEAAKKARYFPATRDQVAGKMWTDLMLEFAE